jgi:NAD(P)-dependent dehydrogenase (short-subunit alcohol dehydrogenase family)
VTIRQRHGDRRGRLSYTLAMRRLLITGGTGALGTVVVERLKRDYDCVLLTRAQADLADGGAVTRAIDGTFHGLVHLAGGWAGGKVTETSDDTWNGMLTMNVTAAFHVIRAILPRLEANGRIIAISSIASIEHPPDSAAYVISKAALNALVQVVARDARSRGITANALLPTTLGTAPGQVPHARVAEAIVWLLGDAAANVTGALIPLTA